MENAPLSGKSRENRGEERDPEGVYRLPEEAREILTRLIVARRKQLLREKFGAADNSTGENSDK